MSALEQVPHINVLLYKCIASKAAKSIIRFEVLRESAENIVRGVLKDNVQISNKRG
jgi:hypothetical protein